MPTPTELGSTSGRAVSLVIVSLVLLPPLYVMSVGPASWLMEHKLVDDDWVIILYRPLFIAAKYATPFGDFLVWYITLWGGMV